MGDFRIPVAILDCGTSLYAIGFGSSLRVVYDDGQVAVLPQVPQSVWPLPSPEICRNQLQQQHCLRTHWFKKLSPSDSRATQKYIHKMRAFKTRNPGYLYPGLGVPSSYFALSHLSSLVLFAEKRKPRN